MSTNIDKALWFRKHRIKRKLAIIIAVLLGLAIIIIYASTVLFTSFGSFTISVKKMDMASYGITLSESIEKYHQIARLNAPPLHEASESRADWIDALKEVDTEQGGSHNGENYMAYTFYTINMGAEHYLTYNYTLRIRSVKNNLDKAIRVRIIVDGEVVGTYGKQEDDGATPLRDYEHNRTVDEEGNFIYDRSPENQITKFSNDIVTIGEIQNLKPGGYNRFTIILWVEGTDPECDNSVLEGTVRMDLGMSVIHAIPVGEYEAS